MPTKPKLGYRIRLDLARNLFGPVVAQEHLYLADWQGRSAFRTKADATKGMRQLISAMRSGNGALAEAYREHARSTRQTGFGAWRRTQNAADGYEVRMAGRSWGRVTLEREEADDHSP